MTTDNQQTPLEEEIEYPSWEEQWQDSYKELLSGILNDDEMLAENIKAHVMMLNYVDKNFESIFAEITKVQRILCYGKETIMFHGFKEFVEGYKYNQEMSYFDRTVNEHVIIRFMPFILKNKMMVECDINYLNTVLSFKIYEDEPEEFNVVIES